MVKISKLFHGHSHSVQSKDVRDMSYKLYNMRRPPFAYSWGKDVDFPIFAMQK